MNNARVKVLGLGQKELLEISESKAIRSESFGIGQYNKYSKTLKTNIQTKGEYNSRYSEKYKKYKEENKITKISTYCWKCYERIESIECNKICLCDKCNEEVEKENKLIREEYRKLGNRLMFNNAINIMSKQNINLSKYKESIEAIYEYMLANPQKFDSSHEIITAIVLLNSRVNLKIQADVGTYKIDFILKEERIALEIDGERHKNNYEYDFERDIDIVNILGQQWEVIRIETKYIETNVEKLYDAIIDIYNYRKEIRIKNSGILPEWYSKRENSFSII